jgi:hypothetical protein
VLLNELGGLAEVEEHNESVQQLQLTAQERADLIEYLKSL